jgi:outer membrane receptor for ferrienterochelin and colicin
MKVRIIIFLFLSQLFVSKAQNENEFFDISVEEMLNTTIEVTNKQKTKILEAPAIVSFITQQEIKHSGARDLIDVLMMIPGIQFGHDVESVVGISMRGFWAHEGKALILWDGIELNENLFGTTQFGNHYDINAIKRIEIIRGPGSALYGGYAGLMVVNIITKDGEDGNFLSVQNTTGTFINEPGKISLMNGNVNFTKKWENGFNIGIHGLYGRSIRSNDNFTDFYGETFNMGEQSNSGIYPFHISAKMQYKNLSVSSIFDNYSFNDRVIFGKKAEKSQRIHFKSYNIRTSYNAKINEKLSIIPTLTVKINTPWQKPTLPAVAPYHYDKTVYRGIQNVTSFYKINDNINIQVGVESYQDYCEANKHTTPDELFKDSTYNAFYYNLAGFVQATVNTKIANFTAGMRYDKHSAFAGAFSPRLVANKTIKDKLTLKFMSSMAFRAPVIENIRLAELNKNTINPERLFNFEVGTTYKFDKNFYMSVNLFNIRLFDPIIYTADTISEYYYNFDSSGNIGVEVESIFKRQWGSITFSYSWYHNVINKVNLYEVPNRKGVLLGNANHKVCTEVNFRITPSLNLNINQTFLSQRYGYVGTDSIKTYKPVFMTNLFLLYTNAFKVKNLELGLGGYNLFNETFEFVEPYNGGVNALPALNRQAAIRVTYRLGI